MKRKGELVYPEFARLPEWRKGQLYGESSNWKLYVMLSPVILIFVGAGLLLLYYALTFQEDWFVMLPLSGFLLFFGITILQSEIGNLFWRSEPSLYENGILWFPNTLESSFLILFTRKFIPFSEIDRILINIPEDFLIEKVVDMTDYDVELLDLVSDEDSQTVEAMIKENCQMTRDKMFILMKDGTEEFYWKKDIKEIDRLKRAFQMCGVKVV